MESKRQTDRALIGGNYCHPQKFAVSEELAEALPAFGTFHPNIPVMVDGTYPNQNTEVQQRCSR